MTNLDTSIIYCEDNLYRMERLPDECIDLVYMDPPFFTGRRHEVTRGATVQAFEDRWAGGIAGYVGWMRERAVQIRRLLTPTGSVYLHCDWHASHYLKVMLDGVFGTENFQNEIVWCYEIGGRSRKRWARKHDDILFYSRSDSFYFNGTSVVTARTVGTHMRTKTDVDGREYQEKTDRKSGRVYRYYLDEGAIAPDFWVGIQQLNRSSVERTGYPTQKPEALLERIITASSVEGGVVLDPCCGSGTTLAVAQRMGRQWIGIDDNPAAVALSRTRLDNRGESSLFDLAGTR